MSSRGEGGGGGGAPGSPTMSSSGGSYQQHGAGGVHSSLPNLSQPNSGTGNALSHAHTTSGAALGSRGTMAHRLSLVIPENDPIYDFADSGVCVCGIWRVWGPSACRIRSEVRMAFVCIVRFPWAQSRMRDQHRRVPCRDREKRSRVRELD